MVDPSPPADGAAKALQETYALSASAMRRATGANLAQPPELRKEADSATEEGTHPPITRTVDRALPAIPGYLIDGELARGGMGAILKGRDLALGRELAIKVALDRVRNHPEGLRRFVEEAQITGQLQHPGIPPVHELGQTPDGRPYFAMKLIKGRTLARLLKDRPDLNEDRPRLVKVFEQITQTLAYAHARGVIHRDLKPLNIMVGKFGEVQVMDWGLAKVMGESHTETVLHTARTATADAPVEASDSHQTQAGSVLGTPAYMPPEQANGKVEALDERGDVFALGSILCEILTGRPAYVGGEAHLLLEMARRGDLADAKAQLDACGAEPDLIELAKSCLAPDAKDRPRDAGIVAQRISGHLTGVQDRLRKVEMERAAAQATADQARATLRAERRVRQLMVGLAAVLIVGLIGLAWLFRHAEKQRVRAEASERLAQNSLEEAQRNFDLALEATDVTIEKAAETEDVKSGPELQKRLLEAVVPLFERLGRQSSADPKLEHSRGLVYQRLAGMRERTGAYQDAVTDFDRMRTIFAQLAERDPANAGHRQHLAGAYSGLGRLQRRLNQRQQAVEDYRLAKQLLDQLVADFPENIDYRKDLAETHAYCGMLKADLGQPTAAEAEFRHALAIREQLAQSQTKEPAFRRDWAQSLNFLAWFQANQGQMAEAEAKFRQALALRAELVDAFPKNAKYRLELSQSYFVLGRLLADLDQRREAETVLRKALAAQTELLEADPNVLAHRQGLARSHNYLGRVLVVDVNHRAEAEAELREAVRIQEALAAEFPFNPRCRQDLAASRSHLGLLLGRLGRRADARTACEQALKMRTDLAAETPDYLAYAVDLAESHCHLGRIALEENNLNEMLDWYAQALKTLQAPMEKHVQMFDVDRLLRYAHLGRARALTQLGRHDEAAADWDEALRRISQRPGRGDLLVEAAVHCAQAAAATTAMTPWREQYLARAVQLLSKAHAAGHFRDRAAADAFKAEPAFAILRGRPEFDRLVVELDLP